MNLKSETILFLTVLFVISSCSTCNSKNQEFSNNLQSAIGPPYPVTAAFFKDRSSQQEWNNTLGEFVKQGGDTVILRAPPIHQRTLAELEADARFKDCGSCSSENCSCWDDAQHDMQAQGFKIGGWLTYDYGENYTDSLMACPGLDRKYITTSGCEKYFRLILPSTTAAQRMTGQCDFPKRAEVFVLFTRGDDDKACQDSKQTLLQSAIDAKVDVFFGLPGYPKAMTKSLLPAYTGFVDRVLTDHKDRYSSIILPQNKTLYDIVEGYYSSDNCSLRTIAKEAAHKPKFSFLQLYNELGLLVKKVNKKFMVSPSINTNRLEGGGTLEDHVHGFGNLTDTGVVDVVAVQEGRGMGQGAYFWPSHAHELINLTDPTLDEILYFKGHEGQPLTYAAAFTASNQDIFSALQATQQQMEVTRGVHVDMWMILQAYEYLTDDVCLPADPYNSGIGLAINRATKPRLDVGLSVGGAAVQKVAALAWDADFTCTTRTHNTSLSTDIQADLQRPIVSGCSFHSPTNLSVVLLGYNFGGDSIFQGFNVEWTDSDNKSRSAQHISGYYFELDYGAQHGLVTSLQYVMLWDIGEMFTSPPLTPMGTIHVTPIGAPYDCYFDYDVRGYIK